MTRSPASSREVANLREERARTGTRSGPLEARLASQIVKLPEEPSLGHRPARRARQVARLHTGDLLAARVACIAIDAIREKNAKS